MTPSSESIQVSAGAGLHKVSFIHRSHGRPEEGRSSRNCRPPGGIQLRSAVEAPRRVLVIGLLISTLGMPMSLNAEPRKGLGMWVWSSSSFLKQEARQQLVQFRYYKSGGEVLKTQKQKEESYEKTQVDPNLFFVFTLYGFC